MAPFNGWGSTVTRLQIILYVKSRAFFNQLLHAVPAGSALFEKLNTFISTKNCKDTCCLRGYSFLNALNLEK